MSKTGLAYTLRFPALERSIPIAEDETIYHSARRHGVRIVGACGGRGTCGTCVVRVTEGRVDHAHDVTDDCGDAGAPRSMKWVRACQAHARSDCTLEVAPRSLARIVRADVAAAADVEVLALDPLVVSRDATVPVATLADNRSDLDRLVQALAGPVGSASLAALQRLPHALRDGAPRGAWSVRVRLRGNELIDVAPPRSRTLGLAVDLGTTNVAGFLVDLDTAGPIASLGIENPQVAWGADLVSRMNHAIRGEDAARELRDAALFAVNTLAHDLCREVGVRTDEIVDVVIGGNTAMHHLLLGLPVRQLGRAPFVAAVRGGVDVGARELGVAVCPGASVHVVPNVGGFVGGDHVATLLATEPEWRAAKASLVMDIGTNTEISIIAGHRLIAASAPSGPALEGGHISCGMRAAEGAIDRVTLADGRIAVRTIGGKDPVGVCGSGVLDALAVFRRAAIVDQRGRIAIGHRDVREQRGRRSVVLAPGVAFTQDDVRSVQLAKAAIRAATELLLEEASLEATDLERFVIAGAFGAYLDVESGIDTGLFPDLPRERFVQVGNAAGLGVRQMVASRAARMRAKELAAECRYVELSSRGGFQKAFLHHIGLPRTTGSA